MVFEKLFERVFETFGFLFLLILVWSAVLGFANPPSWYSFVTYYEGLAEKIDPNHNLVPTFFGDLVPLFTSTLAPDPKVLSSLSAAGDGALDATTIFKAISFFVNLLTGGLLSIGLGISIAVVGLFMFLTQIAPLLTGVAYFFAGSFFVNGLPGVVGTIDWSAMSGDFGYPDPLPSWSFDPSFVG